MKTFAFIFFALITFKTFGQIKEANTSHSENEPWYFLDSVRISKNQMYFDPNKIVAINVVKSNNLIQNNGEVYIKTKNPKNFNFITLADIERNYAKSRSAPALFMLDNKFLKDDISTYKIDSDYILNVEVLNAAEIESLKKSTPNFLIISIKLKTKENIDKANEVYIKGAKAITDSSN